MEHTPFGFPIGPDHTRLQRPKLSFFVWGKSHGVTHECNFLMSRSSFSAFHGILGVPLIDVEDDILRVQKTEQTNWPLTNTSAHEVQAGSIPAEWRLWRTVRKAGTPKEDGPHWAQLTLALWECFWHLSVSTWLTFSFFKLYWVSKSDLQSSLSPSFHWLLAPLPPQFASASLTLKLKSWPFAHLVAPLMVTSAMNTAQRWQVVLLTQQVFYLGSDGTLPGCLYIPF